MGFSYSDYDPKSDDFYFKLPLSGKPSLNGKFYNFRKFIVMDHSYCSFLYPVSHRRGVRKKKKRERIVPGYEGSVRQPSLIVVTLRDPSGTLQIWLVTGDSRIEVSNRIPISGLRPVTFH